LLRRPWPTTITGRVTVFVIVVLASPLPFVGQRPVAME
jgi:hypothetical protein